MGKFITALISFAFFCSLAHAEELAYESFFSKKQNIDKSGTEIYSSNLHLKQHKRFGAGMSLGGSSGVAGINAEINLDPTSALVLGIGTGPSYGTFNIQGKYNFEAYYLSPYAKAGYSKWFDTGATKSNAGDSDILRQIYSEKDLKAGKFEANFATASIGAEYNQLEGELSGLNFFGEVTAMVEMEKIKIIPTGSVGIIYFY
jgi:hypothetical protein